MDVSIFTASPMEVSVSKFNNLVASELGLHCLDNGYLI